MNQHLTYKLRYIAVAMVGSLVLNACQKSFDPNSYKPEKSFGGFSSSDQIAPESLIAFFPFDGNLTDDVSKTSADNSGTTFGTGIKGQALSVGLDHYALFVPTTAIKGLQSFTIAYWINTSINTAGIQAPVCFVNPTNFWGNLDMYFDAQTADKAAFKMHLFGDGGNVEQWLADWSITNPWDSWQHVALSYDMPSGTFTFYVNGVKMGSVTNTNFKQPNFAEVPKIVFGTIQLKTTPILSSGSNGEAPTWASYLLGSIDQLRIYNKALPAKDLNALVQLEGLGR